MSDIHLKDLEKRLSLLESQIGKAKTPRKTRTPSEYNVFVKKYIEKEKKNKSPLSHTELFSNASKEWQKTKN